MRLAGPLTALMIVAFSVAALSDDRATREEARAMAEKAAAHFGAVGAATAFADFQKPEWRDRDLYVFGVNTDGTQSAHGANPALVGRNVLDMLDMDGKLTNRAMLAIEDRGWVEYKWRNPATNAIEPKLTYVIRVNADTILAVGAYTPK